MCVSAKPTTRVTCGRWASRTFLRAFFIIYFFSFFLTPSHAFHVTSKSTSPPTQKRSGGADVQHTPSVDPPSLDAYGSLVPCRGMRVFVYRTEDTVSLSGAAVPLALLPTISIHFPSPPLSPNPLFLFSPFILPRTPPPPPPPPLPPPQNTRTHNHPTTLSTQTSGKRNNPHDTNNSPNARSFRRSWTTATSPYALCSATTRTCRRRTKRAPPRPRRRARN